MTHIDIVNKVFEVFCDRLGLEESVITTDSIIKTDLGCDSIDFCDVIFSIENEFDISISDNIVDTFVTVNDIVNYLSYVLIPLEHKHKKEHLDYITTLGHNVTKLEHALLHYMQLLDDAKTTIAKTTIVKTKLVHGQYIQYTGNNGNNIIHWLDNNMIVLIDSSIQCVRLYTSHLVADGYITAKLSDYIVRIDQAYEVYTESEFSKKFIIQYE